MACCFRLFQYVIAVALFAAIGLVATAAGVDYWWKISLGDISLGDKGLWRRCTRKIGKTKECAQRDNIFQFSGDKNFDIVLVGLVGAGLSYVIAFVFSMITICQKYPTKCFVLVQAIMAFIGAAGTVFSFVWAMQQIPNTNLGWAFYLAYGAGGLGFIVFLLSLVLLCMQAPGAYHSTRRDDEIIMLSR